MKYLVVTSHTKWLIVQSLYHAIGGSRVYLWFAGAAMNNRARVDLEDRGR